MLCLNSRVCNLYIVLERRTTLDNRWQPWHSAPDQMDEQQRPGSGSFLIHDPRDVVKKFVQSRVCIVRSVHYGLP